MKLKYIIPSAVLLLLSGCGAKNTCGEPQNHLLFDAGVQKITINDSSYDTESIPITYKGKVYLPVDGTLKACGYTLGWDDEKGALAAEKNEAKIYIPPQTDTVTVNDKQLTFDTASISYHGLMFVTEEMLSGITGDIVEVRGEAEEIPMDRRDLLEDTVVSDDYRMEGETYDKYNSIYVIGERRGMEVLSITDEAADKYADTINKIADSLPDVNVYCMAVPTACEFYAPKKLYTNQTAGIKRIYKRLNDNVMPINIVKTLMEHADEKIYFDTDHHWTDRGAYYAYCAFMDNKGLVVPPLDEFETNNYDGMVGSLRSFMDGTPGADMMTDNDELLEKFMPRYNSKGTAYNDMHMEDKVCTFPAVNEYATGYSGTFIGGDSPLAVIKTDNDSGRKLVIIKESFGTAFSVWAIENYSEIYVVDPRLFNGFDGNDEQFKLSEFYGLTHFDDLIIINYPGTISSSSYRNSLSLMAD